MTTAKQTDAQRFIEAYLMWTHASVDEEQSDFREFCRDRGLIQDVSYIANWNLFPEYNQVYPYTVIDMMDGSIAIRRNWHNRQDDWRAC